MSRKNKPLLPWLSARADCKEQRFVQVGNSFLFDKKVQEISPGARWLYICMAMESAGKQEVIFTHGSAKKYGIASSSFDRQIAELVKAGFISRNRYSLALYAPNAFRFMPDWKLESAPHFGDTSELFSPSDLPHFGEYITIYSHS